MEPVARDDPAPAALMRPYERWGALLSHVWSIVPVWAIVANALLYFAYRESSRIVCFHARQGILFQLLFLMAAIVKCVADFLARLAAVIGPWPALPEATDRWGTRSLAAILALYAGVCLFGAVQALRGRVFVYPLVGARLYRSYLRARQVMATIQPEGGVGVDD